jgi:hypothetical protein
VHQKRPNKETAINIIFIFIFWEEVLELTQLFVKMKLDILRRFQLYLLKDLQYVGFDTTGKYEGLRGSPQKLQSID